ncbi:MAG: hypothetical protein LBC19_17085 [Tannerella sp.]|nr:hypothetical protein [Tannerella sp.]
MKQKRLFSVIGAIALLFGIGMNFRNALNDYGMAKNSLSGFMLVQAKESNSSTADSAMWKQHEFEVSCSRTTTTTTTTNNNSTTAGGNATAGGTILGVGASATGNASNTSGSTTTTTSTTTDSGVIKGTRIVCQNGGNATCMPFNPCDFLD